MYSKKKEEVEGKGGNSEREVVLGEGRKIISFPVTYGLSAK